MNFDEYMDFGAGFDPESVFGALAYGQSLSGAELLTRTDSRSDEELEELFEYLAENAVTIDLSDLPRNLGSGEAARRLREEEQLVRKGNLFGGLDENDPLRLYLEEVAGLPAAGDAQRMAERFAGGFDRVLGNRFGFGEQFEKGFQMLGPVGLSMAGIICLAPVLASL